MGLNHLSYDEWKEISMKGKIPNRPNLPTSTLVLQIHGKGAGLSLCLYDENQFVIRKRGRARCYPSCPTSVFLEWVRMGGDPDILKTVDFHGAETMEEYLAARKVFRELSNG